MKTIIVEFYTQVVVTVAKGDDTEAIVDAAKAQLRKKFKTKHGVKFDLCDQFKTLIIKEDA